MLNRRDVSTGRSGSVNFQFLYLASLPYHLPINTTHCVWINPCVAILTRGWRRDLTSLQPCFWVSDFISREFHIQIHHIRAEHLCTHQMSRLRAHVVPQFIEMDYHHLKSLPQTHTPVKWSPSDQWLESPCLLSNCFMSVLPTTCLSLLLTLLALSKAEDIVT